MRLKLFLLIACISGALTSSAQTDPLWTLEGVSNATICLYQAKSQVSGLSGTALIINHKDRYYLLTAGHIAKQMQSDAEIVFPKAGDSPLLLDLASIVKGHKLNRTSHPSADLAIIEIEGFNEETGSRLKACAFPSSLIYSGKATVSKSQNLVFMGFPVVDAQIDRIGSITTANLPKELTGTSFPVNTGVVLNYIDFFPTAYSAHVLIGIDELSSAYFYLDTRSIKSADGSPVFSSIKKPIGTNTGRTYLVGLVHGTPANKKLPQFAAITPSTYILDLLKD